MKWEKASFNILMDKEMIETVEGKVTTFSINLAKSCPELKINDEEFKIGVFCVYQLTKYDCDKGLYSITELTTGRRIATVGSLSAATRFMNKIKDDIEGLNVLKKMQSIKRIEQTEEVKNIWNRRVKNVQNDI